MIQDQDLKQVRAGVLDIAYFELGPKDGTPDDPASRVPL
jgi:hypothetical protein